MVAMKHSNVPGVVWSIRNIALPRLPRRLDNATEDLIVGYGTETRPDRPLWERTRTCADSREDLGPDWPSRSFNQLSSEIIGCVFV